MYKDVGPRKKGTCEILDTTAVMYTKNVQRFSAEQMKSGTARISVILGNYPELNMDCKEKPKNSVTSSIMLLDKNAKYEQLL